MNVDTRASVKLHIIVKCNGFYYVDKDNIIPKQRRGHDFLRLQAGDGEQHHHTDSFLRDGDGKEQQRNSHFIHDQNLYL